MHRHMRTISNKATTRAKHGTGEIKPFLNKNTIIQQEHLTERIPVMKSYLKTESELSIIVYRTEAISALLEE